MTREQIRDGISAFCWLFLSAVKLKCLQLFRSMSLLDREQDAKDSDRKNDLDLSKRQNKDEHHRSRPEREEMLLRREPKEDGRRCEDGRRDSAKHTGEKKDQQKRSNSLKSPIRPEGLQPSMQGKTGHSWLGFYCSCRFWNCIYRVMLTPALSGWPEFNGFDL